MLNELTESTLSLFETDKAQRKSFVEKTLQSLDNGNIDVLKLHLQLKCMEDITEQIKASVFYKNTLLSEAEKNGKKFTFQNAEFQIKEAGVKYSYDKTNDAELFEMQQQSDELNKRIKVRQEMLKNTSAAGIDIRINDELVTIYPPAKSSTTTVQVILK